MQPSHWINRLAATGFTPLISLSSHDSHVLFAVSLHPRDEMLPCDTTRRWRRICFAIVTTDRTALYQMDFFYFILSVCAQIKPRGTAFYIRLCRLWCSVPSRRAYLIFSDDSSWLSIDVAHIRCQSLEKLFPFFGVFSLLPLDCLTFHTAVFCFFCWQRTKSRVTEALPGAR